MFDNNFGKYGLILKIISPFVRKFCMYGTHHNDFRITCSTLLHYPVKVENPKMLPNFHVQRDN